MFVGGAIIPQTAFDPAGYLDGIEQHRATEILCVPTMAVALWSTRTCTAARPVLAVRDPVRGGPGAGVAGRRVRDDLGITEITTGYGMTECGGAMTLTLPEDPLELHSEHGRPAQAGRCGRAARARRGDLCHYLTVDPLTGERLADGAEGELASLGPTTMTGYWEQARGDRRGAVARRPAAVR